MKPSLNYAHLELNEDKHLYSLDEETEGLESIEKLVEESIQKDYPFSFKDLLLNPETAEFNFFKMKFPKLELKEIIILNVINEMRQDINDDERKIVLFEPNLKNEKIEVDNINMSTCIYNSINRVVHKTLHGKKDMEENSCIFLNENNKKFEVSENYKNTEIDKKICSLKEKNKIFEFIAIKSLMISITNYMTELINSYLAFFEKSTEENQKIIEGKGTDGGPGDGGPEGEEEQEDEILKFCNFNEIYSDFVSKSNICSSELEEYFIYSLDSFRAKYQMNFTLSELFTDIFWNSIFHNKIMCKIFVNSYMNEDIYGDMRSTLRRIMKIIFGTNIPLKHQIVELLGLHQIENNEKKDLMTLVVYMKNKYHRRIIKSEIEKEYIKKNKMIKGLKEKEKIKEKEKEENINNININNDEKEFNINNFKNNDKEEINDNKLNILTKNEMINTDNLRCNIIKANDIAEFKQRKQKMKTNSQFIENDIDINNNKEKENNNININEDGVPDLSNKTVDEIINYINDSNIIDKSTKGKKKKKSRKNKKGKKDETLELKKIELEDKEFNKFKEDINKELIYAGSITKIKPAISEEWIKLISTYS